MPLRGDPGNNVYWYFFMKFCPIEIVSAISPPCVLILKMSLHSFSHQKLRGSFWFPGVSIEKLLQATR